MSLRRVVIRADASPTIGGGHVMRCLALANVLAERNAVVTFACRTGTVETVPALAISGYAIADLAGPEADEPGEMAVRFAEGADLLVVDHYRWRAHQEAACRAWAGKILVIDDLADRRHDCDVLLDQNLGRAEDDYVGLAPPAARLLIGPVYALLRPEFARARPAALARRAEGGRVRRILVSMGLTDPGNVTSTALDALAGLSEVAAGAVEVVAVLGREAPFRAAVEARVRKMGPSARLVVEPPDMAAEMSAADLCIGAGGSSSWERCAVGLPTVVVIAAENQRHSAVILDAVGAAELAKCDPRDIGSKIGSLVDKSGELSRSAHAAALVTDGRGARRVGIALDPMLTLDGAKVSLRPLQVTDEKLVFRWQCAPGNRRFARNPSPPTPAEHARWLQASLSDIGSSSMIVLADGNPVGLLRLDLGTGPTGEVSIILEPAMQGRSIARAALATLATIYPEVELIADIHPENLASQRAFASAGFERVGDRNYRRIARVGPPSCAPMARGSSP